MSSHHNSYIFALHDCMVVAAGNWRELPSELVQQIKSITGADGAKPYNLDRLRKEYPDTVTKQPFVWVVGLPHQCGTVYGIGNSKFKANLAKMAHSLCIWCSKLERGPATSRCGLILLGRPSGLAWRFVFERKCLSVLNALDRPMAVRSVSDPVGFVTFVLHISNQIQRVC